MLDSVGEGISAQERLASDSACWHHLARSSSAESRYQACRAASQVVFRNSDNKKALGKALLPRELWHGALRAAL